MKRVSAIIVAAGEGRRFGCLKQFALLRGRLLLDWCLEKFNTHEKVDEIILVLPDEEKSEGFINLYKKVVAVVKGGEKRQDSVLKGFNLINSKKTEVVLVHDGVRPLVGKDLISRVIEATREKGAAIPALPIEETIKEITGKEVIRTMERDNLYRIQTPQGFSYSILRKAFDEAVKENYYGTDEAMLVERIGRGIKIVLGDPKNIKITTPVDLKVAEVLLEA